MIFIVVTDSNDTIVSIDLRQPLFCASNNKDAYIGGIGNSTSSPVKTYSGSIQNILIYGEVLTDKTLEKHALTPSMYAGYT